MEFLSNPMSGNAEEMKTSEAYHMINVCRNLRMDSSMINRSNGMIKTGVLGSEFRELVESKQFLKPAPDGQMLLKDQTFMDWTSDEHLDGVFNSSTFDNLYYAHMDNVGRPTNAELLCELEDPANPAKLLPMYSNNPYLVAYTLGRSLDKSEPTFPSTNFLTERYPLGYVSKEECLAWPPG
jgi:hypothetical protein